MSRPEEDFPQFCGRTDSMGVECERPELEKRISILQEQLDAAKAENDSLRAALDKATGPDGSAK